MSQLCQELDQRLNEWRYRSLSSKQYPFILVDALVVDVRRDQAIRSSAVLIAYGVNENGQRETLDIAIDDSESETSWDRFFKQLKARGLTGVDFIVSDAHAGLVKAAKRNFQGSQWQRCQVHFQRNILGNARRQLRKEMAEHLQRIFTAKSSKVARELADEMIEEYERKAPKSMDILDEGLEHATTILQLPQRYHKRLRTTNLPERVNEEIRRRQKVIRIFPNDQAAIRLIGALLAEKNDEWLDAPQRYLNMNEYFDWKIDHSNKTTENTENNIIEML